MYQCYSSVLFGKQRNIHPQGMRAGQPKSPKRSPWLNFGSSFYVFFSPPESVLYKLGQPGGLFVLPEVLTPVLRSFFVLFMGFPLLYLSATAILDSLFLFQDFPGVSDGKASVYNAGDPGSSPGLGRSPGEGMATHSSTIAWKIPWTGSLLD